MNIRKFFRGVVLLLVLSILAPEIVSPIGFDVQTSVEAAGGYALYSGGQIVTSLSFDETNSGLPTTLIVASDGNATEGIAINGFTEDTGGIVKVTLSTDKKQLKVEPIVPGSDTLNITFRLAGSDVDQLLSCKVNVALKIDHSDNNSGIFPLTKKILVMDVDDDVANYPSTYTMKSKIPAIKFINDSVKWTLAAPNEANIISLDNDGKITAKKAGFATITGEAASNSTIKDSIQVIVLPKLRDEDDEEYLDTKVYEIKAGNKFYANAPTSDRLIWNLFAKNNSGNYVKDTTKLVLNHSDVSAISEVDAATKAGNYKIELLSEDSATTESERRDITGYPDIVEIAVSLNMPDEVNLTMNVGDTFSLGHYNIQDINDFALGNVSNPNAAIQLNGNVISALTPGTAVVNFELKEAEQKKYFETEKKLKLNITVTEGITLDRSKANIYVKGTLQLQYSMSNISKTVTWESSNSGIATVDKNGLVTGVKPGVCIITASFKDDSGVVRKATCEITVLDAISGIKIDPAEVEVQKGKDALLSAIVDPKNATNVDLTWVSTNPTIATVTAEKGSLKAVVSGVLAGTTTVVAINKENAIVGSSKVIVIEEIKSIKLNKNEVTANLDEKRIELIATVQPTTAPNQDIVWESSDKKVATVSKGIVTLVGAGTTTIIASSRTHPDIKDYCKVTVNVGVTGLTLESTSKVMYVGEKGKIGYTVLPTTAANKNVVWSSTNSAVASVDANGNITPSTVGQTVIIAKTVDGGYMQTCTIFVRQEPKTIKFDVKDIIINKGEDYKLEYTLDTNNVTDATIVWSSTNPTIAKVSDKGIVTGLETGSTIIIAKLTNGEMAYCNVIVQEAVEGIKLNYSEKTVNIGKTFSLKVATVPDGASNKAVTWESSNPKIATVSSKGTVKGIKIGTAIIKCTSAEGGYVGYCVVTVEAHVTKIKLNKTSYKLALGTNYTLKATVSDATIKKVKWTSSNTSVATVNSSGRVTGRKLGKATITAAATDGSNVKATCAIQVVRPVTSIRLNKAAITMVAGKSTKLKATVNPSYATIKSVKWTSSDETVAKVATNGTISALRAGTTTIKAAARDDSGKAAYCLVTVKDYVPASSVSIITQNPVLIRGESFTMTRSVVPANNTDSVTWVSDNTAIVTINKSTGKMTGKNPGVANISCITESGKTSTTPVTVIGLNVSSITLDRYSTYQLTVEGIRTGITWDITNPYVAVVTNGYISARAPGTAIITATVRGRRLSCRLVVTEV